ncbi:proteoglycan 4a [Ictalurus furcatus]|uniref:proteoglycan 4a n=1 Tax=Ictalurus furcatus TaxID=66913 RepID=UPI00235081F8|nr:proteoglycan 4a [Ictalurus furcatus]
MAAWTLISSVLLIACMLLQLCATQTSCRGRCGEPFSRGKICTCDNDCLTYNECCKDYEEVCTYRGSCRGRCQEAFRRGRECECDPDCTLYNSCCPDYNTHCGMDFIAITFFNYLIFISVMLCINTTGTCADGSFRSALPHGQDTPDAIVDVYNLGILGELSQESDTNCLSNSYILMVFFFFFPTGGSFVELLPLTEDLASHLPADANLHLTLPPAIPVENTAGPAHAGASSPGEPLADVQVSISISGQASEVPNQPSGVSELLAGRPSTLTDIAQALEAASTAGPSPDLCNGLPINGVTSPFNGSIIVFQGHFFWMLDPKTRAAGPARSITADLGIPSPIDTAFTRCNCEGKTYIIKGDNYWSFQNGVMEPGYPRSVSKDFGGLSGSIVAALSVPATRNRPEMVYFFKKGGTVQKLTYPAGSGPICTGKKGKNPISAKNRQPVRLSGEININLKWKGFPTPVTSALSMPNPRKPDGFEHYVFSWPKVFSIKISSDIPVLVSPAKPSAENDVRTWLSCPQ